MRNTCEDQSMRCFIMTSWRSRFTVVVGFDLRPDACLMFCFYFKCVSAIQTPTPSVKQGRLLSLITLPLPRYYVDNILAVKIYHTKRDNGVIFRTASISRHCIAFHRQLLHESRKGFSLIHSINLTAADFENWPILFCQSQLAVNSIIFCIHCILLPSHSYCHCHYYGTVL